MMKNIKILALALLLVIGTCILSSADTREGEHALFARINQIRTAPYEYGISLGYDPVFLQAKGLAPGQGLPPLGMDETLNFKAFQANLSATGADPGAAVQADKFLATAETGSVLSFFNFIPMEYAAVLFADNLFEEEIESGNFQYLLSDKYAYAGVSIMAGISQENMNAWFFSLCFGTSVLKSEIQLLNMINQVRWDPWCIIEMPGSSLVDILQKDASLIHLLIQEKAPLFLDPALNRSARNTNFAVFSGAFIGDPSFVVKNQVPGYAGHSIRSSSLAVNYEMADPTGAVNQTFLSMVELELSHWPDKNVLFSNEAEDSGLVFYTATGQGGEGQAFLSFETGISDKQKQSADGISSISRVYGVLFADSDGNGRYSPGEEIANGHVAVVEERIDLSAESALAVPQTVVTDNAGRFVLHLEPYRRYLFKYESPLFQVAESISIIGDQFVKMAVQPTVPTP